jgi:hypothetical protein
MAIKRCKDCGLDKPVTDYWKQSKGTLKSYCKPCHTKRAKSYAKPRITPKTWQNVKRVCDVCNASYLPVKHWQKRCSKVCGYTYQNKTARRDVNNPGSCARCGKTLAGKRADAIYCSKTCVSMDHSFKRRAKVKFIGIARRREIYERDGGKCYSCGVEVSAEAFELDHLVPVSRLGTSEPSNLAVACRFCNRSRGATIGTKQLIKLFELRA